MPDHSQDAVLLIKVYHDFYGIDDDPQARWPRFDVGRVVTESQGC